MTTGTHGGARPKVRDDDARGKHHSPKPGSGRTPQTFRLRVGDKFYRGSSAADGTPCLGELWTVKFITRTKLTFHSDSGDEIFLIR